MSDAAPAEVPGPDPVVAGRCLDHEVVEGEGDRDVGHAVVRDHQRSVGALGIEVGQQLVDGGAGGEVGIDGRTAVEGIGREDTEVPMCV
ncbi:hypothetical protein EV644_108282 [Kribbella orskensis]|uniref:Uncharacterized protein n=1 Tax=Kribbella orskensis TaxID=2512216 RepID=A0ABY2BIJ9_9ACTN|nr:MULTISPECIES: hypothetical protein [Kribbella]TCN38887.1 hypothetical protein EV642_108282 [Kribbella sp. VKM Ac-2500]TCO21068.1 hypothetical protein EV644_108282 [Kribbella orskensis]